jgi:hypothetical protein
VPFPEGYPLGPTNSDAPSYDSSYELLRGYLHSRQLRWSYGAMKGRPADWSSQLAPKPLGLVLPAVAAAGFQGLWVDPQGYPADGGRQIRSALQALLGPAPLVSPAGDLWFYDLRPYHARLARTHSAAQLSALGQAALQPLRTQCSAGRLSLFNPAGVSRPATLTVTVSAGAASGATLRLAYRGATSAQPLKGSGPVVISRRLAVAPGSSTVAVSAPGASPGAQVVASTLTDDSYLPFAGARPRASPTSVGLVEPPCPVSAS